MKIRRYTDSYWHKKILNSFKEDDDIYTRSQRKFYFDVQLPAIIYILQNTTFELKKDENGKTKFFLDTVKLNDIKTIKNMGEQSIYFKNTIRYYIERYLDYENSIELDHITGSPSADSLLSPKYCLVHRFNTMLSRALNCGETHLEKQLAPFEKKTLSLMKETDIPKIEYVSQEKNK